MRRKLYLHVGVHRTGTTSIQRFLQTNAGALAGQGVLVPDGVGRHNALVGEICSQVLRPAQAAAWLNDQARAAEVRTGRQISALVLSDEDICSRTDAARLAPLRDHFDVTVIHVLRRQDLWLESWYRQNVKWQWNPELAHLGFDAFLARRRGFFWIDYAAAVTRFERMFGDDSGRVLVFDPEQMPEGPVLAFARSIGLTDLTGLATHQHANRSLSALTTEFMRQLPLDEFPDRTRRKIETACKKVDWHVRQEFGAQSSLYMDSGTRAAVMAAYAPGNAALAARLGLPQLFTEPLPPADAALAPRALPAEPARLMAVFVAPLLRALVAELAPAGEPADRPGAPDGG
jgi:hypothetical protein